MVAVFCAQREAKTTAHPAVYRRRQPERSAVYQVVQGHLETWPAGCRNQDEEGFPVAAYIEQDFRKYLDCGILAQAALLGQGAPAAVTISSSPNDAIRPVSPASRSLRLSKSVPDGFVL